MALPKPTKLKDQNTANSISSNPVDSSEEWVSKNENNTVVRKTTSIVLNEPLWKAIKLFCIEHGNKPNRIFEEGIYLHFCNLLKEKNIKITETEKDAWISKFK